MSADPDASITRMLLDWAWAGVAGLGSVVWKAQNDRMRAIEKQSDDHEETLALVFEKLDAHARRSEDRHHELLTALYHGLDRKADK